MKHLGFYDPLPDLVLSGKKDTTWRINNERGLQVGDCVSLQQRPSNKEFAKAEVIWIKMTTFGVLTNEDKEGHEKFSSHQELLDTYSGYYKIKITDDTVLEVIKFKLL